MKIIIFICFIILAISVKNSSEQILVPGSSLGDDDWWNPQPPNFPGNNNNNNNNPDNLFPDGPPSDQLIPPSNPTDPFNPSDPPLFPDPPLNNPIFPPMHPGFTDYNIKFEQSKDLYAENNLQEKLFYLINCINYYDPFHKFFKLSNKDS